jgi:hypothetical protein
VARRVPYLWNEASEKFDCWPKTKLAPLSFKRSRKHLPWEAPNESFRRDAQCYRQLRAQPDVFDERPNAPQRPLAASALNSQNEHLRLAGSVLIESGLSMEELRSLADLVQLERFKTILRASSPPTQLSDPLQEFPRGALLWR